MHILTLVLMYFILTWKKENSKNYIISFIPVVFVSLILTYLHVSVFLETIVYSFTVVCVSLLFVNHKSEWLPLLSACIFLCSLRYTVHGAFIMLQSYEQYENIIACIVQLVFAMSLRSSEKEHHFQMNKREKLISYFLQILLAGTTFILVSAISESKETFTMIVSCVIAGIILFITYLQTQNQIDHIQLQEIKNREQIFTLAKKQYEQMMLQNDKFAEYKHDAIHHYQMLYTLLANNNVNEAKEYLQTISQTMQADITQHYSTNVYIDALLQYKTQIYNDIHFDITMQLQREKTDEIIDFCILLSQLIDFTADIIYEKNLKKELTIHGKQIEKQIFLQIETQTFQKDTNPVSDEFELFNHLIQKFHGTIQEVFDKTYKIQILLNLSDVP